MTWAYSGDPSSSEKDEVRFLVQDTDTDEQLISDEEIAYLISKWLDARSIYYVASMAAEAIAAKFAREATYSADGVSVALSEMQAKYEALAAKLRTQHSILLIGGPDVGGIDPYEQPDPGIRNFNFGTGMHDDLEAGQQDYGSRYANFPVEEYPG